MTVTVCRPPLVFTNVTVALSPGRSWWIMFAKAGIVVTVWPLKATIDITLLDTGLIGGAPRLDELEPGTCDLA